MILGPFALARRDLIGAAVVVVLAIAGPLFDRSRVDPCHTSDGPQFACWAGEAARNGHTPVIFTPVRSYGRAGGASRGGPL